MADTLTVDNQVAYINLTFLAPDKCPRARKSSLLFCTPKGIVCGRWREALEKPEMSELLQW